MKKLCIAFMLLVFLALPVFAQYQGRLSSDDQRRFDSYYQRWQEYKRTNNRDEIVSMEKRMQDVMAHYKIPATTPYQAVASSGNWSNYSRYRGKLSADDQRRFDSYYARWLEYRRDNDRDEIVSMEKRMQDVMEHYDIPLNVPYEALASSSQGDWDHDRDHDRDRNHDRDHDRDRDRDRDHDWDRDQGHWRGRLSADDQRRFDSYYTRWLEYRRSNDQDEIRSMENRMRDVMSQNDIPANVPFDQIASAGTAQTGPGYYGELRILNATYGSGSRLLNVTTRLQNRVQNGHLRLYVNDDSMGGDPAPHSRKALTLTYSYRGREQRVSVGEGGTLAIP